MTDPAPGEVTRLLLEWRSGNPRALNELMPLVYDELRRRARNYMRAERRDHTLQATALVHEVYARLIDRDLTIKDRAHFLSLAAASMRHILVDHARVHGRVKRGGGAVKVELEKAELEKATMISAAPPAYLLELDQALQRLASHDERKARIVELHHFGGLTYPEIAELLEISTNTVERDIRMARAWLRSELSRHPG